MDPRSSGVRVLLVLAASGAVIASAHGVEGGSADIEIVRIRVEDVPAQLHGDLDPCAIDREPQGSYAVFFLTSETVAELQRRAVPLQRRGMLADHLTQFAPRKTMERKYVASLAEVYDRLGLEPPTVGRPQANAEPCDGIGISLQPYDEYHTLDEGVCFLQNLSEAYPEITQLVSIGQSIEGRDIWALKLTDNPGMEEPGEGRILFTGVTHAREWATHEAVLYMAEYLTSRYHHDAQVQHILNNSVVWLVPVVNPDGYEYTWSTYRMWRKNRRDNDGTSCDGVDINRNYEYQWGYDNNGSGGSPCDNNYRGALPASEPETQAIQGLMTTYQFAIGVSYHTYSQLVLYPWGYETDITPESYSSHRAAGQTYADRAFARHGAVYYAGQESYTLYFINGGFTDFGYGTAGALSYLCELRPTSVAQGGFELPEEQILPNAEENTSAALWWMLNVAGASEFTNPVSETLIEDPQLGSNLFSLPLTPVVQKPQDAIGFPMLFSNQYLTWLDDLQHTPPDWGTLTTDFEGSGAGSGYRLDLIDDPQLLEWVNGLESYLTLPYIFENGADIMLSNVLPGINLIGVPGRESVALADVSMIKRVIEPSGRTWGYREVILEERTALEDLQAPSPWMNWNWEYVDSQGQSHYSHPTGEGGASLTVEPFRAYNVHANVKSAHFGSRSTPTYLLRFPGFTAFDFEDCNYNQVPDSVDVAGGGSADVNGNGVPDECECLADLDGSGAVDLGDLLAVLGAWGSIGGPHDLDGSGTVDFGDLLMVLATWGPCPA